METIVTGPADALGVSVSDIADFYDRYWPRKMALGLQGFAKWQFADAPEQGGRCSACVSVAGSELIGVMGLHERRFRLDGETVKGAELTTWIVAPDAKGRGVGPRMLTDLQSRYDVMLGSGISDEALNVYLRMDFNYWRNIPRFFRVWDIDAVMPHSAISPLGRKLWKHRQDSVTPDMAGAEQIAAAEIAGADAALAGKNAYVRDAAHLAWRYDRHPVYEYETYAVAGGGFVVLRRDAVQGMTFAHVVELIAAPDAVAGVLSFLEGYGRAHGLAAMDFTCTDSALSGYFIASGWFSSVDEPSFQYLSLFHPPELRDPQTTSLIYWAKGKQAALADLGRLHFTKGDLDLDRPTLAYYEAHGIDPDFIRKDTKHSG